MKDENTKKRIYLRKPFVKNGKLSFARLLFFLSIILAAFFVMLTLGHKLLLPFPAKVDFEVPSGACVMDSGEMLIVDAAGTRLIFCDENRMVRNIEDMNAETPVSKVLQVMEDENYFYVCGVKNERNTSFIKEEKILRYDKYGRNCSEVLNLTGKPQQRYRTLDGCSTYDNRLYFSCADYSEDPFGYRATVYSVDNDPETVDAPQVVFRSNCNMVFDAWYLPQVETFYCDDYLGRMYRETKDGCTQVDLNGRGARIFIPEADGTLIYSDPDSWNIYCGEKKIADGAGTYFISASEKEILFASELDGALLCYNRQSGKTETLRYAAFSGGFLLLTILKLLSVIYILGLLLAWIVRTIIRLYREKNYELLKKTGIIFIGTCIIIVIAWFYTGRIYEVRMEEEQKDILVQGGFFAETADPDIFAETAECIEELKSEKTDPAAFAERIKKLDKYYGSYVRAMESKECYPYVFVYYRVDDQFRMIYDSSFLQQYGEGYGDEEYTAYVREHLGCVDYITLQGSEAMYCITPVYDTDGEICGLMEVGEDYAMLKKRMNADMLELTMELLTIFVMIYIVLTESRSLVRGFRRRNRCLAARKPAAELSLTRSLNFMFGLVSSFDAVILVLISREMLTSFSMTLGRVILLMALPATAFGIGLTAGTVLYSWLSRHVPAKKLVVGSAVLMGGSCVLMIPAVVYRFFTAFVILKFFSGIFNNIAYTMIASMPYRTEQEADRFQALQDRAMGGVSSNLLGVMIGGFVAQKFGNAILYVVNAVAFIPLILFLLTVIPRDYQCIERTQKADAMESAGKMGKFLFSVPMLSYFAFLTIPLITAGGYRNYLFPLYTTAMDMPQLYVTNLYVFARAIMLLINEPVSKALQRKNHWERCILGMLAMGIAFLAFALNSTVIWASIMLLINAVLEKTVFSSKAMIWPRQAGKYGLSVMQTDNYLSVFEQLVYAFKEAILSLFLVFENQGACVAVGVFCIVSVLLFAFTTRRTALAEPAQL